MYHKLLFDTNIIIKSLQAENVGVLPTRPEEIAQHLYLSTISICELFALPGLSKNEENKIKLSILPYNILSVNYAIAEQAGLLARTRPGKQKRSDLLIAATALIFNLPIFTDNRKDFYKIPGLKLI